MPSSAIKPGSPAQWITGRGADFRDATANDHSDLEPLAYYYFERHHPTWFSNVVDRLQMEIERQNRLRYTTAVGRSVDQLEDALNPLKTKEADIEKDQGTFRKWLLLPGNSHAKKAEKFLSKLLAQQRNKLDIREALIEAFEKDKSSQKKCSAEELGKKIAKKIYDRRSVGDQMTAEAEMKTAAANASKELTGTETTLKKLELQTIKLDRLFQRRVAQLQDALTERRAWKIKRAIPKLVKVWKERVAADAKHKELDKRAEEIKKLLAHATADGTLKGEIETYAKQVAKTMEEKINEKVKKVDKGFMEDAKKEVGKKSIKPSKRIPPSLEGSIRRRQIPWKNLLGKNLQNFFFRCFSPRVRTL